MSIRVSIEHRTTYRFDRAVTIHPHVVRLRPAPHTRTPILAYSFDVTPKNHFLNWQQDPFGNYLARLVFPEPADELSITVGVVADMTAINPFDFFVEESAERFPFTYEPSLRSDLEPYLRPVAEPGGEGTGPGVLDWISRRVSFDDNPRIVDFLVAVNTAVRDDVAYEVRMQVGVQTPEETLQRGIGSCRDSAWLLVAILRELGLAARFVSGYLVQLKSDVEPLDGPAGPTEDFTDLHAWAEVYVPGAGWIGLDATSGLFAGEGHIPLAATPHPASAAPITGATGIAGVELDFSNTVTRIHEDARVTLPYSDDQWAQIDALGERVDALLTAGDVRLTMGGEPTFVSAGSTASPQWEGAADGEEKRELATKLAAKLKERWAPNGLVHHGQGKWYPGEPLPRWQIAVSWRTDAAPLWGNQSLLDEPWGPPVLTGSSSARVTRLAQLTRRIAARLGIAESYVRPAYEDTVAALVTEAQQPVGERPEIDLDPEEAEGLSDAEARSALLDQLDMRSLGHPRGFVVPVFPDPSGTGWATTRWRTRRKALFLVPGDSPLGLRLPLASLAWGEAPPQPERSEFDEHPPLADVPGETPGQPAKEYPIDESPRTALAVEDRDGHAFVFLPPLERLEDGLALLAAVEDAAASLDLPVVLEGYPLPGDPRVKTITVTPDPGVIEVNVHPTSSWPELRDLTTTLYDDARRSGLATEKFDLDGTHTGTGGGNHITLGGPKAADSPLLRRPDLLRSLLTYWQHHPSLSYVFSGRFIGPTSQAPRVDEGRAENLYELEIAFDELDHVTSAEGIDHDLLRQITRDADPEEQWEERRERQQTSQLWLTDRLFRNLLTDVTGNTHRAEFCIDKMYSPETERGRLGLLEMRGFEMPPHPRMALLQSLLVRALVARCWDEPYTHNLVRWGTRLHDRFLLPAYAMADLRSVIADLNRFLERTGATERFDQAWLEPFAEFRFPRLGEVSIDGVSLELRQAVEPWHVLGEEVTQGGTARYVDSSVERVQIVARGLVEGRHVVTCNGVPLPMTWLADAGWGAVPGAVAGSNGDAVAGVRYRAWAPPSALHPTIGVHSPLVFDLVDVWNGLSLGGFTYHVVHPGGRSYDTYPVNAVEAESRRSNRFIATGHETKQVDTSGWEDLRPSYESVEYPVTLDLRRFLRGRR